MNTLTGATTRTNWKALYEQAEALRKTTDEAYNGLISKNDDLIAENDSLKEAIDNLLDRKPEITCEVFQWNAYNDTSGKNTTCLGFANVSWAGLSLYGVRLMRTVTENETRLWLSFPSKEGKPAADGRKTYFNHFMFPSPDCDDLYRLMREVILEAAGIKA